MIGSVVKKFPGPGHRVLVTGAAGLIGSAIIWRLNRMGFDNIIACDRLSGEKWRNLAPLKFRHYIEASDLIQSIREGHRGPDLCGITHVFHMGARSATDSIDAREIYEWNYDFSVRLLKWCQKHGSRLTYASSAATYGDKAVMPSDDKAHLQSLRPTSLYGWFKHRFDLYVNDSGWNNVAGLKFFNVYGQNEHHKRQKSIVFRAHEDLLADRFGVFDTDEPLGRDFVDVKDAASAAIHLAGTGHPGIFNVGTGVMTDWTLMAKGIVTMLDQDPASIKPIEFPKALRGFSGYQRQTQADISRIRATGWEPKYSLARGLDDCLKYVSQGLLLGEEPAK